MPENHSPYAPSSDDVIDLFEVIRTLRDAWKTLALTTLIGLLLALGVSQQMTPFYEAISLVRIASVGKLGQRVNSVEPGRSTIDEHVESIPVVLERIRSKAFLEQVCIRANCKRDEHTWLAKAVNVSQPKNTDIILIVIHAKSPTRGIQLSDAVISELQSVHEQLAKPETNKLRERLRETEQALADLEKHALSLSQAIRKLSEESFAIIQLAQMGVIKERIELYQRMSELQEVLAPPRTRPTERIQAIYLSPVPVSPKIPLILLIGALLGGIVGMTIIYVKSRCRFRR